MEKRLTGTEETRKVVAGFVGDVLRGEHPEKLTSYFDGDTYIQHNTGIADGLFGFGAALEALGKQGIQMIYDKTYMVLAAGILYCSVLFQTLAAGIFSMPQAKKPAKQNLYFAYIVDTHIK